MQWPSDQRRPLNQPKKNVIACGFVANIRLPPDTFVGFDDELVINRVPIVEEQIDLFFRFKRKCAIRRGGNTLPQEGPRRFSFYAWTWSNNHSIAKPQSINEKREG